MEKEFEVLFNSKGAFPMDKLYPSRVKAYLFDDYLRTLLSAFAEEVIGHDKSIPEHMKNYKFHSIACEIGAENRLKARQRLKVKEILSNLK